MLNQLPSTTHTNKPLEIPNSAAAIAAPNTITPANLNPIHQNATSINANPGTPQNPVQISSPEFQVITAEKLATLPEDQQAIVNRFVGNDPEGVAVISNDGNRIATLSGRQAQREGFNPGVINRALVKMGLRRNTRFGLTWLKTPIAGAPNSESKIIFEPAKHIVASLRNGDYKALMQFEKGPDGKFPPLPEAIAIIDRLSLLPKEIENCNITADANNTVKVSDIAKTAFAIPELAQTDFVDQTIVNPESNYAKDMQASMPKLAQSIAPAYLQANSELAKRTNPESKAAAIKTTSRLLFPFQVFPGILHGKSNGFSFNTFPDWYRPIQRRSDEVWIGEPKPLTTFSTQNSSTTIPPELAYPLAWAQLSMARNFPTDEKVIKELALALPERNLQILTKFNEQLKPQVTPPPPHNQAPTQGLAA